MTLLLLIRHAITDWTGKRLSGTAAGIRLSERGREQARALADRLAGMRLAALYASPLERCMETAEAIAVAQRMEVAILPDVQEVGYGRWTNRSLAQVSRTALWRKVQQSPSSVRFPEGETLGEVQQRSVAALEEIAARHRRSTVGIVTHADVIRLVVAHYAGVHIDLFQRLTVGPASVTAVLLGDRIPRILRMNDTGTLEDLAPPPRPGRAGGARRSAARRGP